MVQKNQKKVFVAMSGGVDSSVVAFLLQKQGYDVVGIFMKLWQESGAGFENKCCSVDSFKSAQAVCDKLNIRLYTLNFKELFKEKIVVPFLHDYQRGLTPNPCVACNRYIKFGELLRRVRRMGADYLATGHYVRKMTNDQCPMSNKIPNPTVPVGRQESQTNSKFLPSLKLRQAGKIQNPNPELRTTNYELRTNSYQLLTARDTAKDQSYFLYNLGQQELKHLLFPVGDYAKTQIREIARKNKLPVHDRPESQEVCFVPNNGLEDFLKRHLKLKSGKIITTEGREVGKHKGLALYTIGQRKGIGIGGIGPFYVVRKDYKKNQLIVADPEHEKELYSKELICKNVNWVIGGPKLPLKCQARIRYQGELKNVEVLNLEGRKIGCSEYRNIGRSDVRNIGCSETRKCVVKFQKSIKAVAPGQSVVFYKNNKVLGGGIIS